MRLADLAVGGWGGLACGDALDLAKVIQVVAGHGFDDGLEGHGAALGVRDGACLLYTSRCV